MNLLFLLGLEIATAAPSGPRHAAIELYRTSPTGRKIYVEARINKGKPRIFMVDTGASVSVLSQSAADELGLAVVEHPGQLVGLSGPVPWHHALVDRVQLGPYKLDDVEFAVGVSGVPTHVGPVPVDGILGNNIWADFQLAVDYPADELELARPGTWELPASATPMYFNGQHARVGAVLVVQRGDHTLRQPVLFEVDTGSPRSHIVGASGDGLEELATEGLQAVLGIGPVNEVPGSNLLQTTRRVHVSSVEVGGAQVTYDDDLSWLEGQGWNLGAAGMPGLLGHDVLDGHRVVFDFPAQRFALLPSTRPPASHSLSELALRRSPRHPRTTEGVLRRAVLLLDADQAEAARDTLERWDRAHPLQPRVVHLLAALDRERGEVHQALERLLTLDPEALLASGALIGTVNALALEGRTAEARSLAEQATQLDAEQAQAWVALSDALRASDDLAGARRAIMEATHRAENPDGFLLRRAWVAQQEGDLYAAITHIRRQIELYPGLGPAPWFYALLVRDKPEVTLLRDDLSSALARLHPGDGGLDFAAAAYATIGDTDAAASYEAQGIQRDCSPLTESSSRDNCEAWYRGLVGLELDQARNDIEHALVADPHRSEFLDTYGVVLAAQGNAEQAAEAALAAARQQPADIYLLWQAERLAQLAQQ